MAKRLEDVVTAAFEAGARFGAHYPEPDAWPEAELAIQARAYRDAVAGRTWGTEEWRAARRDAGLLREYDVLDALAGEPLDDAMRNYGGRV